MFPSVSLIDIVMKLEDNKSYLAILCVVVIQLAILVLEGMMGKKKETSY